MNKIYIISIYKLFLYKKFNIKLYNIHKINNYIIKLKYKNIMVQNTLLYLILLII